MLTNLAIKNLAITDVVELDFKSGMSAITGETGAGKSILVDSLGLVLGNRADSGLVRSGAERAEISAEFDVSKIEEARQWLINQELSQGDSCILRRTISAEGRSRAFINGQSVPLAQLKALGNMLIDLHSQHEHHSLLNINTQRKLLDEFAGLTGLASSVASTFSKWKKTKALLDQALSSQAENNAQLQLLEYQLEELDRLDLQTDELEALEEEHSLLSEGESLLAGIQQVNSICSSDESGAVDQLRHSIQILDKLQSKQIAGYCEQLKEARIQLEETLSDLTNFAENFELDQQRLSEVDTRLTLIFELARKHQVQPSELVDHHQSIRASLEAFKHSDENLETMQADLMVLENEYFELSGQLSQNRLKAADQFAELVTRQMTQLALSGSSLKVELQTLDNPFSLHGAEEVEFLIQTNPGSPFGPLNKIASGGELSRISLAIQVICAENSQIPTLIFDEVDVGISGGTSELVGRMLRLLGNRGQVICVTHQPQVSSLAHHHLKVSKAMDAHSTRTQIQWLEQSQRTEELARLLGGIEITGQTMAHAQEMLDLGQIEH